MKLSNSTPPTEQRSCRASRASRRVGYRVGQRLQLDPGAVRGLPVYAIEAARLDHGEGIVSPVRQRRDIQYRAARLVGSERLAEEAIAGTNAGGGHAHAI